jgi:hypothetical protein
MSSECTACKHGSRMHWDKPGQPACLGTACTRHAAAAAACKHGSRMHWDKPGQPACLGTACTRHAAAAAACKHGSRMHWEKHASLHTLGMPQLLLLLLLLLLFGSRMHWEKHSQPAYTRHAGIIRQQQRQAGICLCWTGGPSECSAHDCSKRENLAGPGMYTCTACTETMPGSATAHNHGKLAYIHHMLSHIITCNHLQC